jgi:hypothetical protein
MRAARKNIMSAIFIVQGPRLLHHSLLCATLLATAACAVDDTPRSSVASIGGEADHRGDGDDAGVDAGIDAGIDAGGPQASYIDAPVYFQTPEDIDAWYALTRALRGDFDDVCGDTFCEGDFSNFESLRFRCSVDEASGAIGTCVWVFGASNEEIEPATGAVTVDGKIFPCQMPIAPGTDIHAFVQALSSPEVPPIDAPLPGSGATLFDGLVDCL